MRWVVILGLIAGVGAAGASAQQVKESPSDLSRRSVRAEAEAKAAFERGRAAHNAGKTDEAVSAFERAVALEPTSSLYHLWLGHAYSRQLRTAGFLRQPFIARRSGEAYNMAVKLDPTSIDAAEGRLEFFLGAPGIVGGGVGKAQAEAARLATLDAYRGAMATARIAEHEQKWPDAKRFDEAFKIVDDRLARLPDEASSLYNLGRLSAVSGQHLARGEAAMRRFLTLTTADPVRQSNAHYRLGMIKEKMGDAHAAATEYQAAIDLYPRHEPAATALKKIQRR
jgi:tetratricopeptide (TPR) repeat protein